MVGINSHIFRSVISIQIPSKASVLWTEQHCVSYSSSQWPYKHVGFGHLFYLELLVLTECIVGDCTGRKLTHYFYLSMIHQNYLLKTSAWNSHISQRLSCSIKITDVSAQSCMVQKLLHYFQLLSRMGEPLNCCTLSHSLCSPWNLKLESQIIVCGQLPLHLISLPQSFKFFISPQS